MSFCGTSCHITSWVFSVAAFFLCNCMYDTISPCLVTWHLEDIRSLIRVLAQHIPSGLFRKCAAKVLNGILESRLRR